MSDFPGSENDPLENPELAHPRAKELMKDDMFWNVAHDYAPFGSDEGWQAFYEYVEWRDNNPEKSLLDCMKWILDEDYTSYNEALLTKENLARAWDETGRDDIFIGWDSFTLDMTLIATALAYLIYEGKIDQEVKPILSIAIKRLSAPDYSDPVLQNNMSQVQQVVDVA